MMSRGRERRSSRNAVAFATLITSSLLKDPGDSSGEATPVPIPNTEVKLSSAEDTQGVAPRENRSSPGSFLIRRVRALGIPGL